MKFKSYNSFLVEKFIDSKMPDGLLESFIFIDKINEYGDERSGIANWLFVAPKIRRLMKRANDSRIQRVQMELDLDEQVRKFNLEFQDDLDKTREEWKTEIKNLKASAKKDDRHASSLADKIDRYKENLASKLSSMKEAHKIEKYDIEGQFDRKIEAIDEDIQELETEAEELAGDSEYLNKIRRTLRLEGIIEVNKLKILGASDSEQKDLLAKSAQYKKEITTLAADIKTAIDTERDDIAWSEEQ